VGLPVPGLDGRWVGRPRAGSHVHHVTARRDRCPALPLQPRHDYAADLHRGLRAGQPKDRPRSHLDLRRDHRRGRGARC